MERTAGHLKRRAAALLLAVCVCMALTSAASASRAHRALWHAHLYVRFHLSDGQVHTKLSAPVPAKAVVRTAVYIDGEEELIYSGDDVFMAESESGEVMVTATWTQKRAPFTIHAVSVYGLHTVLVELVW